MLFNLISFAAKMDTADTPFAYTLTLYNDVHDSKYGEPYDVKLKIANKDNIEKYGKLVHDYENEKVKFFSFKERKTTFELLEIYSYKLQLGLTCFPMTGGSWKCEGTWNLEGLDLGLEASNP